MEKVKTDLTGRYLKKLKGRYLLETAASKIEYVAPNMQHITALLSTSSGGAVRSFTVELDGYLAIGNTNDYYLQYMGPFTKFEFKAHQ